MTIGVGSVDGGGVGFGWEERGQATRNVWGRGAEAEGKGNQKHRVQNVPLGRGWKQLYLTVKEKSRVTRVR